MYNPIKLILPLLWKGLKLAYPRIKNYLSRPNILVSLSSKRVEFLNKKTREIHHFPYFCLLLKSLSKKNIRLNSEKIKINESFYHHIIFDVIKNNHGLWELWNCAGNDVLNFYRENLEKLQNKFITLGPGEEKIFPMHLPAKAYRIISGIKHNSLPFLDKNKIFVEIETNGRCYEYSSAFRPVSEKFMAYIASDFEITESRRKTKGKMASLVENPQT